MFPDLIRARGGKVPSTRNRNQFEDLVLTTGQVRISPASRQIAPASVTGGIIGVDFQKLSGTYAELFSSRRQRLAERAKIIHIGRALFCRLKNQLLYLKLRT